MLKDIWNFIVQYIAPASAVIIAVFIVVKFYKYIKARLKRKETKVTEIVAKKVAKPEIVKGFLNNKLKFFLETLRKAVPSQYIIHPHVNAEMLFSPNVREDLKVDSEYCDFVVFNKDYIPILVIDMVDITIAKTNTGHLNEAAEKFLKAINVPVLDVKIQEQYNIDQLRLDIAGVLNPLLNK